VQKKLVRDSHCSVCEDSRRRTDKSFRCLGCGRIFCRFCVQSTGMTLFSDQGDAAVRRWMCDRCILEFGEM
jgi:hypothetical protein